MSIVKEYPEEKELRIKRTMQHDPVANFMEECRIEGNSKYYVLLSYDGNIFDSSGRNFEARDCYGNTILPAIKLRAKTIIVHRKHLYRYIGGDAAQHFWKSGRVVKPKPVKFIKED